MRRTLLRMLLAGVSLNFVAADIVQAEVAGCGCWPHWLSKACSCCCDDYCVKPLPPVECAPAQCCPDCYCVKPLPAVDCMQPCRVSACYDCKPLPSTPRCCEPWYKCIPFCSGN